jgi:predicted transposase YdaD
VVLGANSEAVRRIVGMKTFSRLLEEMGWTAQWEAQGKALGEAQGEIRGESKKALEIVKRALAKGMPVEDIADLTGVDSHTIRNLKN